MNKTISKKSNNESKAKVPTAFNDKEPNVKAASDNDSKYEPTEDAIFETQTLSSRDGVLKLFVDSIKDIYWAESHLVKSLPKMINAASSQALQRAITNHLKQTQTHVSRLEKVLGLLSLAAQARKCDAMEGLTKEGEAVLECTDAHTPARDLGIILASQKVEHYEISAYIGLVNLANRLDLGEIAALLSQTLTEEKEADNVLAAIADDQIEIGE